MRKLGTRLALLYFVFIAMTIAGLISTVSGVILLLSGGSGGYRGGKLGGNIVSEVTESENMILGLERDLWKNIHTVSSITCVVLVIIHIVLNWRWILNVSKAIFK